MILNKLNNLDKHIERDQGLACVKKVQGDPITTHQEAGAVESEWKVGEYGECMPS